MFDPRNLLDAASLSGVFAAGVVAGWVSLLAVFAGFIPRRRQRRDRPAAAKPSLLARAASRLAFRLERRERANRAAQAARLMVAGGTLTTPKPRR